MEMALDAKLKLGFIDGTQVKPNEDSSYLQKVETLRLHGMCFGS